MEVSLQVCSGVSLSLVHFTSWFLQGSLSRIKALLVTPACRRRLRQVLDRGTGDMVTPALMCHSLPIHGRHTKQGTHQPLIERALLQQKKRKSRKMSRKSYFFSMETAAINQQRHTNKGPTKTKKSQGEAQTGPHRSLQFPDWRLC